GWSGCVTAGPDEGVGSSALWFCWLFAANGSPCCRMYLVVVQEGRGRRGRGDPICSPVACLYTFPVFPGSTTGSRRRACLCSVGSWLHPTAMRWHWLAASRPAEGQVGLGFGGWGAELAMLGRPW